MEHSLDDQILRNFGGLDKNSLLNILNQDDDDYENISIFEHSPFHCLPQFIDKLISLKSHFTVLSLNSQSLNAKFDKLLGLIEILHENGVELSAICLQETWLDDNDDLSLFNLENYICISQGKRCCAHGGLIIYLHKRFNYIVKDVCPTSDIWEGLFVDIFESQHNKHIFLGNIYKPPKDNTNVNIKTFTEEITSVIQMLSRTKASTLITGDFNIDLLKVNERIAFGDFFDSMLSNSFFPAITLPTRFSENSCTLIDNIFFKSNVNCKPTASGILISDISDHLPYFTCINIGTEYKNVIHSIKKRIKTTNTAHDLFCDLLSINIMDKLDNNPDNDPNHNYNTLESIISKAIDTHMPFKNIKFNKYKHKKEKWITTGILKSIKYRDKIYKTLKLTNPNSSEYTSIKQKLVAYRSILKKSIRHAKQTYYTSVLHKFKYDAHKTWGVIKNILKTDSNRSTPSFLNINGSKSCDEALIANQFNNYFSNIGKLLASNIHCDDTNSFKKYLTKSCKSSFEMKNTTSSEICTIIKNLKPKNSSGYDQISANMLKLLEPILTPAITLIINQSINTGIFPEKLKIAKVVPVFKKGDTTKLENYRPISLLPSVSKIFEKIAQTQLLDYFESNSLLCPSQYGFRQRHSTEHAILEFVDRIISDMDQGFNPIAIFLDLSKAFDTLDHQILIQKLKYYGIKNKTLNWLTSYLTNRKQYVQFNNTQSTLCQISTGVPQGSILGPLLFIIYINDFAYVSNFFRSIHYADDTSLIHTPPRNKDIDDSLINSELSKIHTWLSANKLSLNVAKTKYMIFATTKKKAKVNPHLHFNLEQVERVSSFSFLGITVNEHMTWSTHIDNIGVKLSRNIGIIQKLKYYLPIYTLKTLYHSLIHSHLNYGILAWGHNTERLFKLQKRAIRSITNSSYNAHSEPLFKATEILKVSDIYKLNALKFYFNYLHFQLPHFLQSFPFKQRSSIHSYNTRGRSNLCVNKTNRKFADACLRNQIPTLVNSTPSNILEKVNTHSLHGFSKYVKTMFLTEYQAECSIRDCYICSLRR